MRLSRDPFSIHGSHGIAQGLEMPGKFLLENQQEVTHEFAVIFDARQQFSEINHRIGHVLFPPLFARYSCAMGFCAGWGSESKRRDSGEPARNSARDGSPCALGIFRFLL